MKALVSFFQDNAMFYKDITQWLRKSTFASLFFGLLLVAEALSLFIIAGSDEMTQPGVSMFYILFMVLIVYAVIIGFLGQALTSKEFVNRTFELFELSGMSLERMIGGKLLSMLYQFFFGFFCLVPFMFFSYFLGGLDFFEMLVGVVVAGFLALPLYLFSLMVSLVGRFGQINLLGKLAGMFFMAWFLFFAIGAMFSGQSFLREMISGLTEFFKVMFGGNTDYMLMFGLFLAVYGQLCLLVFYFCCNSISRETDSREIPIKVLTATLILSWMAFYISVVDRGGATNKIMVMLVVPIFLALMGLALITYYSRPTVPPIVKRRYRDAGTLRRWLYWWLQPGMVGGVRTILGMVTLILVGGWVIGILLRLGFSFSLVGVSGSTAFANRWSSDWYKYASLIAQIPWFLTVPYLMYLKGRDLATNYTGQRTLMVATWVITGALVMVYFAWTKARFYGSSSGSTSFGEVALVTLLSPLSSLASLNSSTFEMESIAPFLRYASGAVGTVLMLAHLRAVTEDVKAQEYDADITETDVADVKVSGGYTENDSEPEIETATDRAAETHTQSREEQ